MLLGQAVAEEVAMSPEVPITVLVDEERFDEALLALADAGVQVDAEHREIGVVSGRVGADRLDAVAALDGVRAVEPDRTVQLPDPDADVQ
jgi:hypothetical protein